MRVVRTFLLSMVLCAVSQFAYAQGVQDPNLAILGIYLGSPIDIPTDSLSNSVFDLVTQTSQGAGQKGIPDILSNLEEPAIQLHQGALTFGGVRSRLRIFTVDFKASISNDYEILAYGLKTGL